MRILHTSDWHLGRSFHEQSLIEDQAHALKQLLEVLRSEKPDLLIIAGDLYDRAVPPKEAVCLLDETLSEIQNSLQIPCLLISGNHDSGERVSFGSRLFASERLRIVGTLEGMTRPLVLEDRWGKIECFGIPYFDAPSLKSVAGESAKDPASSLEWCVKQTLAHRTPGRPAIAVAHAFLTSGKVGESENRLSIGGSEQVSADLFEPFIYTALGHLHRPQSPTPRIRYSGSLLPYHFSESDQPKSFTLVELEEDRVPKIREIPIRPLHALRIIEGAFDELVALGKTKPSTDFILARRTYDGPRVDVMGTLRRFFPNLLCIELVTDPLTDPTKNAELRKAIRTSAQKPDALFSAFFKEITKSELSTEDQTKVAEYFRGEE